MSSFNLDEQQTQEPEYFDFVLGGHTYRMRFPTTAEALAGKAVKDGEEGLKWLCGFATKLEDEAPELIKVLMDLPVNKLRGFNALIKKQFGDEA